MIKDDVDKLIIKMMKDVPSDYIVANNWSDAQIVVNYHLMLRNNMEDSSSKSIVYEHNECMEWLENEVCVNIISKHNCSNISHNYLYRMTLGLKECDYDCMSISRAVIASMRDDTIFFNAESQGGSFAGFNCFTKSNLGEPALSISIDKNSITYTLELMSHVDAFNKLRSTFKSQVDAEFERACRHKELVESLDGVAEDYIKSIEMYSILKGGAFYYAEIK